MKKVGLSILLGAFFLISSAQTVLTIADEDISLVEFKNIFEKNNHNLEITKMFDLVYSLTKGNGIQLVNR